MRSEMVPGVLPCTSSSYGVVTIASAMSDVESDTRVIGRSVRMMADRPTSRSSCLTDPSPTALSALAASWPAWAIGGSTMMTNSRTATARVVRQVFIIRLLSDDDLRTLVAADDFDSWRCGRRRRLAGGHDAA